MKAPMLRTLPSRWLVLGGFAVFALLATAWVGGCDLPSAAELKAIAESPPVDPEPHRTTIESIERVLFRNGPISEEQRASLCQGIARLSEQLARGEPSALVARFRKELGKLGAAAGRLPVGKGIESTSLRREWQRIRGSLFSDAPWFEYAP